jgi:hypothetical protein
MKNQQWIGGGIAVLILVFLVFHWSHIADTLGIGADNEADLENCKTLRVTFAFSDYPDVPGKTKNTDGSRTHLSILNMMQAFDETGFVENTVEIYEPSNTTHFSFAIVGEDKTEFLDQIRHKGLAYKLTCIEKNL